MFEGFEGASDAEAKKRWMASTGTSLVIYLVIGAGVAVFAGREVVQRANAEQVDVTFHSAPEPEIKHEAPPPPPPPKASAAKRAGRPAPATPTAVPEDRPAEGEPTGGAEDLGTAPIEDFGEGGTELAPPPPPPPPVVAVEPEAPPAFEDEEDDAVACVALAGNQPPVYPDAARKKGIEGEVVLKVSIAASGEVTAVTLVRGDEPFAAAAIEAVRTWKYRPALLDGRPVASTRIVSIPFRIRT